jgi:hypothetical protein
MVPASAQTMRSMCGIEVTTTHDYQILQPQGQPGGKHSVTVVWTWTSIGQGDAVGKLMEIEVPSASNTSAANVEHVPKKKAPPSAYNYLSQENSAHVRAQLESSAQVPQPEVMKACARLWREQTPSRSKIITPTVFVNKSPLEIT